MTQKKIYSRPRNTQTCLRLPEETLNSIRSYADERGVPYSEIIRDAIDFYMMLTGLPDNQRLAVIETQEGGKSRIVSHPRLEGFSVISDRREVTK